MPPVETPCSPEAARGRCVPAACPVFSVGVQPGLSVLFVLIILVCSSSPRGVSRDCRLSSCWAPLRPPPRPHYFGLLLLAPWCQPRVPSALLVLCSCTTSAFFCYLLVGVRCREPLRPRLLCVGAVFSPQRREVCRHCGLTLIVAGWRHGACSDAWK